MYILYKQYDLYDVLWRQISPKKSKHFRLNLCLNPQRLYIKNEILYTLDQWQCTQTNVSPNEVPWIMHPLYDASLRQMVPVRNFDYCMSNVRLCIFDLDTACAARLWCTLSPFLRHYIRRWLRCLASPGIQYVSSMRHFRLFCCCSNQVFIGLWATFKKNVLFVFGFRYEILIFASCTLTRGYCFFLLELGEKLLGQGPFWLHLMVSASFFEVISSLRLL